MDPASAVPVSAAAAAGGLDERRLDAALERIFPTVTQRLGGFLIGQMLAAAREMRLDYESVVLWGVMSLLCATEGPPSGPGVAGAVVRLPTHGADRPRAVRLHELARISGIPRETVRRRLLRLEVAGRVERVAFGWRVVDRPDDPVLRSLTRNALAALLSTACELDAALAAAVDADDPRPLG
jgi:hypothetical protein